MDDSVLVDTNVPSRELVRQLRLGVHKEDEDVLPESVAWQTFVELRRRGDPDANDLFMGVLRSLHRRRTVGLLDLPPRDTVPFEHKLIDDSFLGDLWNAYKKCIRSRRTGPASQLLRDIAKHIDVD